MNRQIQLNPDQLEAMQAIEHFLNNPSLDAFVLCGSAGTGKTTLVAKIIEQAKRFGLESMLVAPTGRAAQILQGKLDRLLPSSLRPVTVSTLHAAIYFMASMSVDETRREEGRSTIQMDFPIRRQGNPFDLLIVDEASMVGDNLTHQPSMYFGTGRLLNDLVTYIRHIYQEGIVSRPVKVLFVGDPAQLPPVGSTHSPALCPEYLYNSFGLQARRYELTTVMRQGEKSSILSLANQIREQIFHGASGGLAIPFNGQDVRPVNFHSAVELIANNIRQNHSCAAVVYSNATAHEYNLSVRSRLWGTAYASISPGERLLVMRNSPTNGLSNGDLVLVHTVMTATLEEKVDLPDGHQISLRFKELRLVSDSGRRVQALVLENLLFSDRRDLQDTEQHALYLLVRQRNPYVEPDSAEFRDLLQDDPYYNALQVKFGYAMTCHKAQGGEWKQVIVDLMGVRLDSENGSRWLYTAVTRASNTLCLVA
jgi:hypothetical protein